ncbi:kyphoscoliosis peptidase-like isoform X2 [Phyllobates terribilis]|uniref:kyphoscoliosis peptidase-like isoform X2 n=1 Tax=Phyllobates terribilis TaxID=111132 RepID=UPI003CCB72A1
MAALHERLKLWQRILLGIFCFPLLPFYLCVYCLCLKDDNKVKDFEGNRQSSNLENGRQNQTRLSFVNQDEDRDLQEKKKQESKPAEKFYYPWDRSSLKSLQIDLKALEKLDLFASKLDTEGTVEELVQALVYNTNTELEKTRAIWIWICYHIEYDYEAYKKKVPRSTDPNDILRARKGFCAGYASLFQHMCSIAGLQCKKISGYSKGSGYEIGQKISGDIDHAWNMIYLKGSWHLLDSTWGAGVVVGDLQFTYRYNEIYFLTHPAIFIMDHLPDDPECQLLETCLSHKQFEKNVYLRNNYYIFNMVSYHPQICVIETVKGKASIAIESGCKMKFSFKLNKTETPGILKLTDNGMNLDVYPQKTGQHILSIFARKENAHGDLQQIMEYRVDCSFVDTSMIIPKCLNNPVVPNWISQKAGLFNPSHPDPIIHADDGLCTISFRTEKMLKITVSLRSDDIQTMPNHVIVSVKKDKVEFIVRLPQAGSYALLLFDDVTGIIGNYLIVCSNPKVKWSPFPSFLHNPVGPSSETEKAGLLQPSHSDPIISAEDGTCTISFALKKDIKTYCTLDSDEITLTKEMESRHVFQTETKENVEIKVHLPRSGKYVLRVFIKPRESTSSTYSYLCNYLITCSNPSVKWPVFPLAYNQWEGHFELYCPLEGVLPKNSNVFFRLKITDVAAVCAEGKMSIPLTLTDSGYWEGTCSTKGVKELFISIKYNKESDTRHYILKYTIENL